MCFFISLVLQTHINKKFTISFTANVMQCLQISDIVVQWRKENSRIEIFNSKGGTVQPIRSILALSFKYFNAKIVPLGGWGATATLAPPGYAAVVATKTMNNRQQNFIR